MSRESDKRPRRKVHSSAAGVATVQRREATPGLLEKTRPVRALYRILTGRLATLGAARPPLASEVMLPVVFHRGARNAPDASLFMSVEGVETYLHAQRRGAEAQIAGGFV